MRLAEFAPSPDRDNNDDVPDQLLVLANRWWNATDRQPQIEHVLNSLGWSIHQVESEDDAVQLQHRDGTTYFISADDFDPDLFEYQEPKIQRANRDGIDLSFEKVKDDEYVDDNDNENTVVQVTATSHGKELGHVLFSIDGDTLLPQDLEVDERYRGQGIAKIMYDYVKSLGYQIRRSGQQTDAGAGFWSKHRPAQNVWEEKVNEISDELRRSYLDRAGKVVDRRMDHMAQVRDRLNKGYEIYHADRTADGKSIVDRFDADTPALARQYYEKFITRYESDVDFDLRLRRATGIMESYLNEASSDEAWELVGQPVPEIQQFVKQMGYSNDEQSVAKITPIIDSATATQIPAASIPKLKNLANKGNDVQTLKAIQQISGRPDAAQQYTRLMQARDAGEGRNRGYPVGDLIQAVKSGNYDAPVLLKLPTGTYVVGGRTRLYAALALGIPAKVKIISVNNFKQGVAETVNPMRQQAGRMIDKYFGKIYEYGDSGLDYLDNHAPTWYNLSDQYNGDIDVIIATAPANLLAKAAQELKKVAGDLGYELNEIARIPQGDFGDKDTLIAPTTLPQNRKPLPGGSNFTYAINKKDPEYMEIMIYDEDQLVAELDLFATLDPLKTWGIETVAVDPDYRGRGLGKALYGIALSILKLTLEAGETQTKHGQAMWIMLNSIPGVEVKGYAMEPTKEYRSKPGDTVVDQNDTWTRYTFPVEPGKRSMRSTRRGTGIYSSQHVSMIAKWTGR
jgi:GNAT superfamily N-acetyltransferase